GGVGNLAVGLQANDNAGPAAVAGGQVPPERIDFFGLVQEQPAVIDRGDAVVGVWLTPREGQVARADLGQPNPRGARELAADRQGGPRGDVEGGRAAERDGPVPEVVGARIP